MKHTVLAGLITFYGAFATAQPRFDQLLSIYNKGTKPVLSEMTPGSHNGLCVFRESFNGKVIEFVQATVLINGSTGIGISKATDQTEFQSSLINMLFPDDAGEMASTAADPNLNLSKFQETANSIRWQKSLGSDFTIKTSLRRSSRYLIAKRMVTAMPAIESDGTVVSMCYFNL
jgi:hypothetical protein